MLRNAARLFVTHQHKILTRNRTTQVLQHLETDLHNARETIKELNEFLKLSNIELPKPLNKQIEEQLKHHESNKHHSREAKLKYLSARKHELLELHKIAIEQLQTAEQMIKAEKSALKEIESEVNTIDDEVNALHFLDSDDIEISSKAARDFAIRRDL